MRYVLIVQSEKVSAFAVGCSKYSRPVVFLNGQQGQQQFAEYLEERGDSLFTIVLDSKDEEHHQEQVPVLKRTDEKKVLSRLLRQYFPSRALCTVTVQRRKQSYGLKRAVTITGVGDKNDCDHWLALLKTQSTLVTEIYSLSLLGASMPVNSPAGVSLCAVQTESNEFRLLAFEDNRLLISRHIKLTGDLAAELNAQLLQTIRYIETNNVSVEDKSATGPEAADPNDQSIIRDKVNVSVVGDLPTDVSSLLAKENIEVFRWGQLAQQAGTNIYSESGGAAGFFSMLTSKKQSRGALLSKGSFGIPMLSRRVKHLLVAGSLCCLGVTMAAAATTAHYSQTYESLTEFAHFLRTDSLQPLPHNFSNNDSEYPIDAVRDALRVSQQLQSNGQHTPIFFMAELATDLTLYPEIQVTAIKWGRTGPQNSPERLRAIALEATSLQQTITEVSGEGYTAMVEGYLRKGEADSVSASGRFNSFVAALKAANRYSSVKVIESPFAMSSERFGSDQLLLDEEPEFLIELINQAVVQ